MIRALSITYLLFSILGVFYLAESLSLPMGTGEQPGAGFFPMLVGVLILCLSISAFLLSLKKQAPEVERKPVFPRGQDRKRVIAVTSTIFFFVVFLKPLGYCICSAGLMGAILRLLGLRSWVRTVGIAVLAALLSYYIFALLLDVPLPRGSLIS
jgi:putative tricarboxylic transport membrane protein